MLHTLAEIHNSRIKMIDFGLVDAVDAEAIGVPGQRTFRVRARVGLNRASLWMEKEQLSALGRAFSQLLAERSQQQGSHTEPIQEMGEFEGESDVELQIARLALDFNSDSEHIVLVVDDQESLERGDTPTFRMEITRPMTIAMIDKIPPIVNSGRPICPLCTNPLESDGAHFCPGSNGHSDQPIPSSHQDPAQGND